MLSLAVVTSPLHQRFCPAPTRKNNKNQPFWVNLGIFASSDICTLSPSPPQKFCWCLPLSLERYCGPTLKTGYENISLFGKISSYWILLCGVESNPSPKTDHAHMTQLWEGSRMCEWGYCLQQEQKSCPATSFENHQRKPQHSNMWHFQ